MTIDRATRDDATTAFLDGALSRTSVVIAELDEGPCAWSQLQGADPEHVRPVIRLRVAVGISEAEREAVPVFLPD